MRGLRFLLLAGICVAFLAGGPARAATLYGAVVIYGDPIESGAAPGAAFSAPTEADVTSLAVERCKANTVTPEWGNCSVGRWIATGRYLLVATVCEATDARNQPHRLLEFLKDGVTASDEEIREAVQRVTSSTIPEGGCRKVAVFDARKPELTNPDESGVARSVAKDKR